MVAPPQQQVICELCGANHAFALCQFATDEEQVQYVSNQGRQGNFSNQPFKTNDFANFSTGSKSNDHKEDGSKKLDHQTSLHSLH
jgi:hypothetical protein